MTTTTSDSSAYRVEACPAAAVLPKANSSGPASAMGSAFHEHRELLVEAGYRDAIKAIPAIAAKWGVDEAVLLRLALRCTFVPPKGAWAEMALAWTREGGVVPVEGGHGHYPSLPEDAFGPGQIDLFWSEPEPLFVDENGCLTCPEGSLLWVLDYKTGNPDKTSAIEQNEQLLNGAAKAARLTGASLVMPALLFVSQTGEEIWDVPRRPMTEEDVEQQFRRALARQERVDEQARRLREADGPRRLEVLEYNVGPHCTYCDSRFTCPAVVGEIRQLVSEPVAGELSPEVAQKVARLLPLLKQITERTDRVLRDYVGTHGPIDLGDGNVWGPHDVPKEGVDPRAAIPVLVSHLGSSAFDAVEISKAGIERAAKAKGLEAAEVKRLFGALRGKDAFVKKTETWWTSHRR